MDVDGVGGLLQTCQVGTTGGILNQGLACLNPISFLNPSGCDAITTIINNTVMYQETITFTGLPGTSVFLTANDGVGFFDSNGDAVSVLGITDNSREMSPLLTVGSDGTGSFTFFRPRSNERFNIGLNFLDFSISG